MDTRTIAVGSDHAGFEMKETIKKILIDRGYSVKDFGTHSLDSVDYPDFAHPLAASVERGEQNIGFLFCGSANGVSITANKHQGIRCALCWIPEIAELARKHNNANVCAIPARFTTVEQAEQIAKAFLNSEFEGGRHQKRVDKIALK